MAQAVSTAKNEEQTLSAPLEAIAHISEEVMEKVKEVGTDVSDRVESLAKDATKSLKGATKNVSALIKRNPLEAIALGFGIGFLTAFLIRRSR